MILLMVINCVNIFYRSIFLLDNKGCRVLVDRVEKFCVNFLVSCGMIFIYMLVAMRFLPQGINWDFVARGWKRLLVLMVLVFILFLLFIYLKKDKTFSFQKRLESILIDEALLILFPMTPIVQYILLNRDTVNFVDVALIVLFFVSLTITFAYVVPWTLSIFASRQVLTVVALSFLFTLFNMSSIARTFKWHLMGSFPVQAGILLGIVIILLFLRMAGKKSLYFAVVLFFIANTASSAFSHSHSDNSFQLRQGLESDTKIYEYTENKKIVNPVNIYLLIYDSYANEETMKHYGIDNSEQISFLKHSGFTIYPGIYSVGAHSTASMSTMLDVSLNLKGDIRAFTSGYASVPKVLSQNGYNIIGIFSSDYFLRGQRPYYDEFFPISRVKSCALMIASILEGEFRFDFEVEFGDVHYPDYVKRKRHILTLNRAKPVFMYTHTHYPGHSQNSGKCLPDETERYLERLEIANDEMKEDIETVIHYNPNSIVIVAGDHGPYLTKNCTGLSDYAEMEIDRIDVQDRYGIFLAIRWPEGANVQKYDIKILQDVFPAVLSYIYGDSKILGAKIPATTVGTATDGVRVENGIIVGGKDDGKPLFENAP